MTIDTLTPTRPHGIEITESADSFLVSCPIESAAQTWQYRFPRSVKALLLLRDVIEYLIAISGGVARAARVMPKGVSVQSGQSFHRVLGLDLKRGHDELFQIIIPSDPEALDRLQATIDYLQYHPRRKDRITKPTAATVLCALLATALFLFAAPAQTMAQAQGWKTAADNWEFTATLWEARALEDEGHDHPPICNDYRARRCLNKWREFNTSLKLIKHQHARPRRQQASPTVRKGSDPTSVAAGAIARTHPVLYLLWQAIPWKALAAQLNQPEPRELSALPTAPCIIGDLVKVNGVRYKCVPQARRVINSKPETQNSKLLLLTAQDRRYRTQLREASTRPANFARHYILATIGCGSECLMGAAIDTRNGSITWLPFAVCCWFTAPGDSTEPLLFRLDANVVIVNGKLITATETRAVKYATYRLVNGRFVR